MELKFYNLKELRQTGQTVLDQLTASCLDNFLFVLT